MNPGQILVINLATIPQPELLGRAREVAQALQKEVFVCCLLDDAELPPPLPGRRERVREIRKKLVTRCKNALERALDDMNAAGITAHGHVATTAAAVDASLKMVEKKAPAIVLICRKPHSRLAEATLSGSDFAIIRACPVPVWVVNPELQSGDKIVGAIDTPGGDGADSSLDRRILDSASSLARKMGKEHHALHTFGQAGLTPSVEPAAEDPEDDMGASRYDRRVRRVFDFAQAHGLPRERIHIHEGKLVNALEEMSGPMNAHLIVVGARRRGRLQRMLAGSAAERVVQRVRADVLVLKGRGLGEEEPGGIALH